MSLTLHPSLTPRRPVVALESTLIAHGLPWPINLETALEAEEAVRGQGAIPATIAVLRGRPTIGLERSDLEHLARTPGIRKASSRDLAAAIAQNADAATTVSATMRLAHAAGIRVFATGGIGGVHHGPRWDVSADLAELARTPVVVVCAGAKSILDLPATLEMLETFGVPVVGYGTSTFPAFYVHSSGLPVSARVESPQDAAALIRSHWELGGAGVVLALPLPTSLALDEGLVASATRQAEVAAEREGIRGPALTPFLLRELARLTNDQTLSANRALIVANASLAAQVAVSLGE